MTLRLKPTAIGGAEFIKENSIVRTKVGAPRAGTGLKPPLKDKAVVEDRVHAIVKREEVSGHTVEVCKQDQRVKVAHNKKEVGEIVLLKHVLKGQPAQPATRYTPTPPKGAQRGQVTGTSDLPWRSAPRHPLPRTTR